MTTATFAVKLLAGVALGGALIGSTGLALGSATPSAPNLTAPSLNSSSPLDVALIPELILEEAPLEIASTWEPLPSLVFVMNDRVVAAEMPDELPTTLDSGVEQPGTVRAITGTLTILPSRTVVVDDDDNIVSVSNDTNGTDLGFYALRIREHTASGPEHPFTQGILSQYFRLAWTGGLAQQ